MNEIPLALIKTDDKGNRENSTIIYSKKLFFLSNINTAKSVYRGHLRFLKKVSAITRSLLYRALGFLGTKRQQKLRWRMFFIR